MVQNKYLLPMSSRHYQENNNIKSIGWKLNQAITIRYIINVMVYGFKSNIIKSRNKITKSKHASFGKYIKFKTLNVLDISSHHMHMAIWCFLHIYSKTYNIKEVG